MPKNFCDVIMPYVFTYMLIEELKQIIRVGVEGALNTSDIGDIPVERPAEQDHGDFSSAIAFSLAKQLKKNPAEVAREISTFLNSNLPTLDIKDLAKDTDWQSASDIIDRVEAKGPFINIWLCEKYLVANAALVIETQENYGRVEQKKDLGPVIVEYSSINVGKPMSIGHLRSTVNGDAIANLLEATGHEVVRINYLGDWGTQFGKLLVGFEKWGDKKAFKAAPTIEMLRVYVKFHDEVEKDPKLDEQARAAFKKLEEGDSAANKQWKKFRKATLEDNQEIYDLLEVEFDEVEGESTYVGQLDKNLKLLEEKHLLSKSQGALIVDLEKEGLPPFLIQKTNDSSLYASRELAAAQDRYERYKFSKMIYEVGIEQELHFRQLFDVLKKMGFEWADRLEHVKHGLYSTGGKKMSTRKGKFSNMLEILNEAVERADKIIQEKNPELKNRNQVAKQVGIGAIKYHDLSQNRLTNISFDFDRMLSLEGNSAPYLQYAYARIQSILDKAKVKPLKLAELGSLKNKPLEFSEPEEQLLLRRLTRYTEVVSNAAKKRMPHLLASELFELAGLFNLFYGKHQILKAPDDLRDKRLFLISTVAVVLKNGLSLLGIHAPNKM